MIYVHLVKLLILLPFFSVMYFMCTDTRSVDSLWETLGFIFLGSLFKLIKFSLLLIQTTLFPFLTFKTAEKGKKVGWFIGYLVYNCFLPGFMLWLDPVFEKVRPLIQIIFDPSQEGILAEFWSWFKSSCISLGQPIKNLISFLPDMSETTFKNFNIGFLIINVILVIITGALSFSKVGKKSLNLIDGAPDSTIKVVWPWQSGWDKKKHTIWPMVILCIVTVGLAFLVYWQKKHIISILNQNIGAGGSILTTLNIVILICLFGSNFYFYIKNYGTCWLDNESPDKNDQYTLGGIGLFIVYLGLTLLWLWWNKSNDKYTFGEVEYMLMILVGICFFSLSQFLFKHEDCQNNDKPGDRINYWMKFIFGISGSWSWLIFLLAIMIDRITGLFNQKYSTMSLGIIPFINNIFRTIMLFIANFIGFIPYWLGDVNFGKI